jgi:peptide/nickel transport system substrate-binding protein
VIRHRRCRRWLSRFALALATLTAAVGSGVTAEDDGGTRTLTIGITQFPATLHPSIGATLAKTYLHGFTRRPITAYDANWAQVCIVCREIPTLDNGMAEREQLPNGDTGIAVTYRLHPEATWGDGEPVTSADVKFTWQVGKHPESGVAAGDIYRRIRNIEIHGPKKFTVHIDRVTFDYNDFALPILPEHLEREVFEADPAQYRNRTTFDRDSTNPGLYFGPYVMADVTTGVRAVFERNPTWFGERPYFDRIVVRVIENTAALEANLLSGAIDMIAGELGLRLHQAIALKKRRGERFRFTFKPGLIYEHIEFNLDDPVLSDRTVRRALAYGANRRAITDVLFDGEQPVAHTNVSPLDRVFADDVRQYTHDPAKARRLLRAAGWTAPEAGAIRTNADGEKLRFSLMTTAGERTRQLVQQVLQSQWREIGVDIRIDNEPARVFFGRTVTRRQFPHMAMFAWISSPESVPRGTLHSEQIPSEANAWSGQNVKGYANPEVDELIDSMERELDDAKRERMWHRLQRIYARDLPALPLYWRAQAHVLPTWLKGVTPTGHQFPTSMWVEEWEQE